MTATTTVDRSPWAGAGTPDELARWTLGTVGGHLIQVLFATSLFACILSFHNIATRYFFSLGRRGVLHSGLATPHRRWGSPSRASLVTSGIVFALLALAVLLQLDPITQFYTWLGGISSVGVVLLLTLTSVAVLAIFRKDAHSLSRWRTVTAPVLGLIGLVLFLAIILVNLPVLVGEAAYGPFSFGVLALLIAAFALGPVVAATRKDAELD